MQSPENIMIVEDHEIFRRTLKQMLGAFSGFSVIAETGDSTKAIILAETLRPSIILMDISIKPVSGIVVTEMIRGLYPAVQVIGLSMHIDPRYALNMLRAGGRGYVSKNSPLSEIVDAIMKVASGGIYISDDLRHSAALGSGKEKPDDFLKNIIEGDLI